MVIHLNKKMKTDLYAFAGGIVIGFGKLVSDQSVILMASKTAAIIEGCGTALLFGACGVIGKKLGDIVWMYSKKLYAYAWDKYNRRDVKGTDGDTKQ